MRSMEALAIRERDIDWNGINFANRADTTEPAMVRIRKEYSKTRRERHIFISNEAARYLNGWLDWKYRNRKPGTRNSSNQHLVFGRIKTDNDVAVRQSPAGLYDKMGLEFRQVLTAAGFITRKQDGVFKRRIITFHSFRRFVKTTIANQCNSDYSEWFLGHSKSPCYTNKPGELKKIYKDKCMKYLTFLDYPTLEATGRNLESKLNAVVEQKDKQITELKNEIERLTIDYNRVRDDRTDEINYLKQEIEKLKAASRDHINTQVKESESIEGIKVSPELTEMLYKTAKQRIDTTVSKFMKEHLEYFEDKK